MAGTWRTWSFQAAALCRAAQKTSPTCIRPGRPEAYEQWQIASLIFTTVARRCKSKSAQWRSLDQNQEVLLKVIGPVLGLSRLPGRATYMRRYPAAWPVFEKAIEIGGRRALREHVANARSVAVDKSLIKARGPVWAPAPRRRREKRPGVDVDAGWGKSAQDGWVWG
jgi:hypothetical protein